MARVDFYVLEQVDERSRQVLACKLAEKAWRLENTVYIHTNSRSDAATLDELLWTFRDGSFVPHAVVGADAATADSPILIGCEKDAARSCDLLINLGDDIPPFAPSFPRIAELVTSDDRCRKLSRKRFVEYRDQGHEINTHNL